MTNCILSFKNLLQHSWKKILARKTLQDVRWNSENGLNNKINYWELNGFWRQMSTSFSGYSRSKSFMTGRKSAKAFFWMLPDMNCSKTHIRWSLPLMRPRPASYRERQHNTWFNTRFKIHIQNFKAQCATLTGIYWDEIKQKIHWHVFSWISH